MSWDYADCVAYVKKNASTSSHRGLLLPMSRRYERGNKKGKSTNISIVFYSMPDFLHLPEIDRLYGRKGSDYIVAGYGPQNIGNRRFDSIVHEYRHTANEYLDYVAKLLGGGEIRKGEIIKGVEGFGSGRAMLDEITAVRHRSLRIMPIWHAKLALPGINWRNAVTLPVYPGQKLASVTDGTLRDYVDAYAKDAPITDGTFRNNTVGVGSGKGSDVVVFFSPEQFDIEIPQDGPGYETDAVLFHELVHVSRQLRGKMTGLPVTGVGNFGNEEEYLATVITNLYLSEKGKDLRGDYNPSSLPEREIMVSGKIVMWVIDPPPKNWAA